MVQGEIDEDPSNVQARAHIASICRTKKSQRKEKSPGKRKAEARHCTKAEGKIYFSDPEDMEFIETMDSARKEVELAKKLCNAVQSAKDLKKIILEGA